MSNKLLNFSILVLIGMVVFRLFSIKNPTDSKNFKLEGQITSNPYLSYDKLIFYVGRYKVESNYQNLSYADNVSLVGDKVGLEIKANQVNKLPKSGLELWLQNFRNNLDQRIRNHFPNPQAELLSGILLGIKSNLPREFKAALVATGTIHVVVVSGYNIVLIASFILLLAPFIGRKKANSLALLTIIIYSFLVGFSAPTIRALIMGSTGLVAVLLGKRNLALYSLFLAFLLMLVFNPEFIFDISFQLTFAATLGVMLFSQPIEKKLKPIPKWFAEIFATSLAAQILVLPLIFFYFGSVSIMSPLVNSLVLWTVPISTILGFIFLAASFLGNILADIVSYILVLPLTVFTTVVSYFGNLNFLVLNFEKGNWLTALGYYLLILALVLGILTKRRKQNESK